MKFGQKFTIRKGMDTGKFARGIWNPTTRAWSDVVEDYLYISRERINNKLCMFKLQTQILMDVINHIKFIDSYKKKLDEFKNEKEEGKISEEDFDIEESNIKSEIFSMELINKALRDIIDGIVWKYFNFNRAFLYTLADRAPIETIRPDKGLINSLYEFSEVFLKPKDFAIFNDISNFLRIGDVTHIDENGNINFIEVKSSRKLRGSRITRQKKTMAELVEFFNTGEKENEGIKYKIIESNIRQKNYLKTLSDSILRARSRGYDSILIGNYLILEIADYNKKFEFEDLKRYFKSKHASIREEWKQHRDFVIQEFFIDRISYSKNFAPFSIYPFDVKTCTDILMGRIMICSYLNYSEIFRLIEKAGWQIIDALILKSKEEIEALNNMEWKDVDFLTVRKPPLNIAIPPSFFGRLQFELLSPKVIIENLEEHFQRDPKKEDSLTLVNYLDEKNIWIT